MSLRKSYYGLDP